MIPQFFSSATTGLAEAPATAREATMPSESAGSDDNFLGAILKALGANDDKASGKAGENGKPAGEESSKTQEQGTMAALSQGQGGPDGVETITTDRPGGDETSDNSLTGQTPAVVPTGSGPEIFQDVSRRANNIKAGKSSGTNDGSDTSVDSSKPKAGAAGKKSKEPKEAVGPDGSGRNDLTTDDGKLATVVDGGLEAWAAMAGCGLMSSVELSAPLTQDSKAATAQTAGRETTGIPVVELGNAGHTGSGHPTGGVDLPKEFQPVTPVEANIAAPEANFAAKEALAKDGASPTDKNAQAVDNELSGIDYSNASKLQQGHGTHGALSMPRMSFADQKNESAGLTVQKLPRTADDKAVAGNPSAKTAQIASFAKVSVKEPILAAVPDGFRAASTLNASGLAGGVDGGTASSSSATQVEKLSALINQEMVTIRQSGAASLAVSLKVDAHTEVFVQLTSHEGQIQASVRCERGSFPVLGTHWDQLQESLARQNIQLIPSADRVTPKPAVDLSFGDLNSPRHFEQPAQEQGRPGYESRVQPQPSQSPASAARPQSPKLRRANARGWESWA
ncbi:MAG TPA: hypothetical protein VFC07_13780 [Verrucomicrobiae bacterium]|nr:hypothetical protein [Verrucomicrobiae bacterium]